MRKRSALIPAILALFAVMCFLGACSHAPTPTETVDTFLQAIKSQDNDALSEVYSGGEVNLFEEACETGGSESTEDTQAGEGTGNDALDDAMQEQLMAKILDFDYELSNEQIDGEHATVDVTIRTYRIGDAFTAFFGDYLSQAFVLAFSDASEEELDALATSIFTGKLAELTEKSYEKTATVSLTMKDGKWMVDDLNDADDEFIDALTGGLVTAIQNLSSIFDDLESEGWETEEQGPEG